VINGPSSEARSTEGPAARSCSVERDRLVPAGLSPGVAGGGRILV